MATELPKSQRMEPMTSDRRYIMAAALHNLELDLNGGDTAAVQVVRDYLDDQTLTRDKIYDLIADAESVL